MRISDWSSDVCSSDLDDNGQIPRSHWSSTQPQVESAFVLQLTNRFSLRAKATLDSATDETKDNAFSDLGVQLNNLFAAYTADHYALYGGKMDLGYGDEIGRASCRERVCQYV